MSCDILARSFVSPQIARKFSSGHDICRRFQERFHKCWRRERSGSGSDSGSIAGTGKGSLVPSSHIDKPHEETAQKERTQCNCNCNCNWQQFIHDRRQGEGKGKGKEASQNTSEQRQNRSCPCTKEKNQDRQDSRCICLCCQIHRLASPRSIANHGHGGACARSSSFGYFPKQKS